MAKIFESVTRRRQGAPDRFGDRAPGTEVVLKGVRVGPRDSREGVDRANSVVTAFTLLIPKRTGYDVIPTDQLLVRGQWRSVDGEPFDTGRKGLLVSVAGGTG